MQAMLEVDATIDHIDQARLLTQRVQDWLEETGLSYKGLTVGIRMVKPRKVKGGYRVGGAHYTSGNKPKVNVASGLSPTKFMGTFCHELGHVWLNANWITPALNPEWATEGFCELLTYRFYQHLNTDESLGLAEEMLKWEHPVYGDGLRWAIGKVDAIGLKKFLKALQKKKSFSGLDTLA